MTAEAGEQPIVVRIMLYEISRISAGAVAPMVLARLREAGIPVMGTLVYRGLERGEMSLSIGDGVFVYTWTP